MLWCCEMYVFAWLCVPPVNYKAQNNEPQPEVLTPLTLSSPWKDGLSTKELHSCFYLCSFGWSCSWLKLDRWGLYLKHVFFFVSFHITDAWVHDDPLNPSAFDVGGWFVFESWKTGAHRPSLKSLESDTRWYVTRGEWQSLPKLMTFSMLPLSYQSSERENHCALREAGLGGSVCVLVSELAPISELELF